MKLIFTNEIFSKESDILCALRGPDNDSDRNESLELKVLTTGRIRGFVLKDYLGAHKITPLSEEEQIERDKLLHLHNYKYGNHFGNHYHKAVARIKILIGYDLWNETQDKNET